MATYFATIHTWLPFVSKVRLLTSGTAGDGEPDLVLLSLSIKLVTALPVDGIPTVDFVLYRLTKRFLASVEHSGYLSIRVLQSMVLLALYEYSHGIYPAAWMTIGTCARFAGLLALPETQESAVMLDDVVSQSS